MKTLKLDEEAMKKLKELKLFCEVNTYSETVKILYYVWNKNKGDITVYDQSKK